MAKRIQNIYIGFGITVLILATLACGQVSVGVITPTAANAPGETHPASILVPTSVSTTPTPVSSPESGWEPTATTVPEELNPRHGLSGSGQQCVGTRSGQRDASPGDF